MAISQFDHDGTRYNFEPPIETGDRTPKNLGELIVLALNDGKIADGEFMVASLAKELVFKQSDNDPLHTLNVLLDGKHQATIAKS